MWGVLFRFLIRAAPATLGGIATIGLVAAITQAGREWWPWAMCYVERTGLTLAIKVSEVILSLWPPDMPADDLVWIGELLSEVEWWFPVGGCVQALSFWLVFFLALTITRWLLGCIPFVRLGGK